ncbi:MAG: RadC family protein [Clostridia bacterium]|nr:RadC family protein [Clostridia bacterium]
MAFKHHHGGHRARLRARFQKSPESFEDHELLELLLFYAIPQKDTNALAHELLYRFGSLSEVLRATSDQIAEVAGMGETSSQLFPVLEELFRRSLRDRFSFQATKSYDPKNAGGYCLSRFFGKSKEHIVALILNSDYAVAKEADIGSGDSVHAVIDTKELCKFVSQNAPCNVVIAHNHPSGVALPSEEDYKATDFLRDYVFSAGGTLLDHLIFDGKGDFVSLGNSGQMYGKNRYYYQVRQIEENCCGQPRFEYYAKPFVAEIMTKDQTSDPIT